MFSQAEVKGLLRLTGWAATLGVDAVESLRRDLETVVRAAHGGGQNCPVHRNGRLNLLLRQIEALTA
jgi:hypothetical protein